MMTNDRGILVRLDGSPRDEHLRQYAAMVMSFNREANPIDREDGSVRPTSSSHSSPTGDFSHSSSPLLTDEGHRIILTAPECLRFARTSDAEELLRRTVEEQTDVILIGEDRCLARRLVCQAAASVWLIPDESPLQVRRILVPVDFTNRAADCLRVATVLARFAGAECRTVHVHFRNTLIDTPNEDRAARRSLNETYARFLSSIDTMGVAVTGSMREGSNTGRAVARAAEEEGADLIVMASRGRTPAASWVLESVAEQTIRETRVPLLVVKHFGARLGLWQALREKLRRPDETRFG
jgi:nucleotide-binding universal stress UspA family protein